MSAGLVLDEMLSPEIASELVKGGHEVVAVAADPGLVGLPDEQVLEWATSRDPASSPRTSRTSRSCGVHSPHRAASMPGSSTPAPGGSPGDRRFVGALVVALVRMISTGQLHGSNEVGWLVGP